ncbi:hypothetical protein PIROE2DRAFT_9527 [Piromyces sp. E2]|nr:hypothetical protein PIROE2DRAFT_9527 [Piromyces sp. E2]|eukprot:OUM63858.1 hypothetical protein PIROE2DRAFT_9527 [Piromyces sp. E2]
MDIIKNNQNNNNNELILEFVDDYYDMLIFKRNNIYNIEAAIQSPVIFRGNSKGTVFDYNNDYYGNIDINFDEKKGTLVRYENIIFKNYNPSSQHRVGIATVISHNDDFHLQFYNCTFINIIVNTLVVHINPTNMYFVEPQILFDKCNFYNNTDIAISVVHENIYLKNISDIYKYFTIKFSFCKFIDNDFYFEYYNNGYIFDNCYFSNPINNIQYQLFLPLAKSKNGNILKITNSVFENIYIKSPYPLILADGLDLELKNTTFVNCFSDYGYLFDINKNYEQFNISVEDSTFTNTSSILTGDNNHIEISNSIFKNIISEKSIPAISNSRRSNIKIKNTEFNNLKLSKGLFNEESTYEFNNIKFYNIISNSKSILYFIYNDVILNNIEFNNITSIGDNSDASFILYDSSENKGKIEINKLNGNNSLSNGSFIKIIGNSNSIIINNSSINNIISYGPVIKVSSEKVIII